MANVGSCLPGSKGAISAGFETRVELAGIFSMGVSTGRIMAR